MHPFSFYTIFVGTIISVISLTYIARKEHNPNQPKTLSEIAAQKKHILLFFRLIVWGCGLLFAVTVLYYILPRIGTSHHDLLFGVYLFTIACELLLGLFAARDSLEKTLHEIFAYGMGVGLLLTAVLFAISLNGIYSQLEYLLTFVMVILCIMAIVDKKRFIFYELPFIYLSHFTIIIATVALSR
jgi:hypothetical protein